VLASGVKYSLGSQWAPVPAEQQTFTAVAGSSGADDDGAAVQPAGRVNTTGALAAAAAAGGGAGAGGADLASAPFTPPSAPAVFTTFLLGSKSFGYSLLPQVDAPETGPCKPAAQ
jgi:hypothetical protein